MTRTVTPPAADGGHIRHTIGSPPVEVLSDALWARPVDEAPGLTVERFSGHV